ncbi:hypothetical protein JQX08_14565 [Pseudomonas sp. UL073]|uniref:Uncharacterized protein n=1 Tax=Zestomonas insulae TaxID=2809017 RepID=A0ABS2IFR8_9GAMM|nr:hypothetical protein [Pseudomonas insulae]MBM7061931.1 hypothetical protein [Pseudomonas insulae]
MSNSTQFILDSLADQQPILRPRPDGSALLELCGSEIGPLRVIEKRTLECLSEADKFIKQLRREMQLQNGDWQAHALESASIDSELPTYTGQAIYLRAMQTLVERRRTEHKH